MSPAMPPDQEARDMALSPSLSFIVQAPAGSGKTELLIRRFLRLLARVDEPEQVLAITFTRKAAGEMRARVIAAIDAAVQAAPPREAHLLCTYELAREVLNDEGRRAWQLHRHPARLNISTIDAVNAWLASRAPLTSGGVSSTRVTDSPERLYREAARATLDLLAEDSAVSDPVARLLAHLDNDARRFEDMLVAMLPRRDQWLRHVVDGAGDRYGREAALRELTHHGLQQAAQLVSPELAGELVALLPLAAATLRASGRESSILAWERRDGFPQPVAEDLPAWLGLAEALVTADDDAAWRRQINVRQGFAARSVEKVRMEKLLLSLQGQDELRKALRGVRRLPGAVYSAAQWDILQTLMSVLRLAAAQLQLVFIDLGEEDFPAVAAAALDALGGADTPSELGLALDYRIQHILVDEFQDTSLAQFELMGALTAGWTGEDGRTLFLVGDPMQSIYRFRQAEVGLFMRVRDHGIGSVRPRFLQLTANFRSVPTVVDWNNRTFGATFPVADDAVLGGVRYAASTAFASSVEAGGVHCHWLPSSDAAAEAERVVDLVMEAGKISTLDRVCILVRSRGHAADIIKALRNRQVPFNAPEMEALQLASVAQDLLALARAMGNPVDRLAWVGVLRSPLCGLSLRDLHALLAADHETDVCTLMQECAPSALSPHGRAVVARLLEVLSQALRAAGRVALRDLVEGVWLALGGPATLRDEAELQTAGAFLDMLESAARQPGGLDLVAFGEEIERGKASLGGAESGVRIMTIHKAKGLEFDTVILPGLGKRPRSGTPPLLLWHDLPLSQPGSNPILAPISATGLDRDPLYDYLAEIEQAKQHLESQRLVYVACTRARQELHLLAHVALLEEASSNAAALLRQPVSQSLLAHIWPLVREDAIRAAGSMPCTAREAPGDPVWVQPLTRRLPSGWQLPVPALCVAARGATALPPPGASVEYEWASAWAMHAGAVAHRWLQIIAERGTENFPAEMMLAAEAEIRGHLERLGTTAVDMPAAVERVREALLGTLADPTGRWVLSSAHAEARNEWAITVAEEGRFANVVIDRSFVTGDGVRWIIDYKTSSHLGAGVEEFLRIETDRYRAQLQRYRLAVTALGFTAQPIRTALYYPLLSQLVEVPTTAV